MCTLLNFTAFSGQLSINTISATQQPKGDTQLFSVTGVGTVGREKQGYRAEKYMFPYCYERCQPVPTFSGPSLLETYDLV